MGCAGRMAAWMANQPGGPSIERLQLKVNCCLLHVFGLTFEPLFIVICSYSQGTLGLRFSVEFSAFFSECVLVNDEVELLQIPVRKKGDCRTRLTDC
jgi:hypothetical protein